MLLAHPGGPIWARRDLAAWSIPKGEIEPGEDARAAAAREFTEELGLPAPGEPWVELGDVVQRNRKRVTAWAVRRDLDPATIVPGTVTVPWPPRSGRTIDIPEVDRVAWFDLADAGPRMVSGQQAFLERLVEHLAASGTIVRV